MSVPRVAFLITNHTGGFGGHFNSLRATISALEGRISAHVIEAGISGRPSPVLAIPGIPRIFVKQASPLRMLTAMRRQCDEWRINAIHSFDLPACFFANALSGRRTHLHTKCGGPNPRVWYPAVAKMVMYSAENALWFRQRARYRNCQVELLPQRATEVAQDHAAIERLRQMLSRDCATILRIGRICTHYKSVLEGAVRLQQKLVERGARSQLLIIGAVQDADVLTQLRRIQVEGVHFVTEPEYTLSAARLIDVGDLVIGTGRNLMEAALRGRAILSPIRELAFPVLSDPARLDLFAASNYSPRNSLPCTDADREIEAIQRLVCDADARHALGRATREFGMERFHIKRAAERIAGMYAEHPERSMSPLDAAMNLLWMSRSWRAAARAKG